MTMRKDNFNIMTNIKIIEDLKAQLLCIIGEFFKLLTKGNNTPWEIRGFLVYKNIIISISQKNMVKYSKKI